MNRNCPNCGAPIDLEKSKCEYCGTCYFDISSIPINEPFYLRLNIGTEEKPVIVCQKVISTGVTIAVNPQTNTFYADDKAIMAQTGSEARYDIEFTGFGDQIVREA